MSGPKTTNYRLERRIRQMIQQDIACTQQCKVCSDAIQAAAASMRARLEALQRQIGRLTQHADRASVDQKQIGKIQDHAAELEKTLQQLQEQFQAQSGKEVMPAAVTAGSLAAKRAKLSALRGIQSKLEQALHTAEMELTSTEKLIAQRNVQIDRSIARDLQGVSFLIADEQIKPSASNPPEDVEREKQALYAALEQFVQEGLTKEVHQHVQQAMLDLSRIAKASYLQTFKAVTFERIKQEAAACRELLAKQQKEYVELTSRYAALCERLDIPCKDYAQSEDGMQQLKAEIEAMEARASIQAERAYIARCVDETMAEMGYQVIGYRDVRKKSGKHFRNELYTFHEGSAVNITYASDGQITMEIGGLAHGDRLPDDHEAQQLTEDMDAFCGEFKLFEEKLKEKGVLVGERIQLLPPAFEYAQIINIDDYHLQHASAVQEMEACDRTYSGSAKRALMRDE